MKLPELYDNCGPAGTPKSDRSNSYQSVKKGSKIERELQQLSLRRQREEEELKQRFRKAHRQQQLDRQSSQPVALLLPIRARPNRAKKSSNNSQRNNESNSQSYNSSYSVKSDSGISTSLRQSDTSDKAEESEWSGWDEGEQLNHEQRQEEEEEVEEYEDAEEDDPGYEEEDEYEDANETENYYCEETNQNYHEGYPEGEQHDNYEQCDEARKDVQYNGVTISGYSGARHRRFRVAQSQNAEDYQPRSEMDSTEKCKEWLNDRRRENQKEST